VANKFAMSEQRWEHETINALVDKSASTTGLPPKTAAGTRTFSQVVGFDAGSAGGLRPFQGFRYLHDFMTSLSSASVWENGKPAAYTVRDMRGFSLQVEEDERAYGFVYKVQNSTDTKSHWFIDFWVGSSATVYTLELTEIASYSASKPWAVVTVGRLLYLFVRGEKPTLFYIDDKTNPLTSAVRVGGAHESTTVGPGAQRVFEDAGDGSTPAPPTEGMILRLQTGTTGLTGGQSSSAVHTLEPGAYKFAAQFVDSNTGRRGPLTEISVALEADFTETVPGTFDLNYAKVIGTWDTTEWDTIQFFRSIRRETAGSDYGSVYLHLDSVYTLNDIRSGTASGSIDQFTFIYEADDQVLARQEVWLDTDVFDTEVPAAGEGVVYENSMLLTDILPKSGDAVDENTGRGETRYSSLAESSYELFRPGARVAPTTPDQRFIRILNLGEGAIGLAYSNLGHFHREGYFIRSSRRIHKGLGLVHPRAAAEVAEQGYYVNDRGVKVVHATAALEDLTRLNYLIQNTWAATLSSCRMAYDSQLGALFLLNSSLGDVEVMWLNTGRITSLEKTDFATAEQGSWPSNPSDLTTPLKERAFFLRLSASGTTQSSKTARVYVTDITRAKHATAIRLLDLGAGDSYQTIDADGGSGVFTVTGTPTWPTRSAGARLYVTQPGDGNLSRIGNNARIISTSGGGFAVDPVDAAKFAEGDRLALCPVVQRVVTTPLLPQSQEGYLFTASDYFRQKQVKTVGASFAGVGGSAAGTTDAVFAGVVYEGDSLTALVKGLPKDGDGNVVASVMEGAATYKAGLRSVNATSGLRGNFGVEGAVLAFGIEILACDLDYNLVSLVAEGALKESDRNERPA